MDRVGPVLEWDFNLIMIPLDKFEEAVQWYSEHFGWKLQQRLPNGHGEKAFFGVAILKAIGIDHEHLGARAQTNGEDPEGNARLRFAIGDYDKTIQYFQENGIPFKKLDHDPEGRETIEITAFGGAKLIAVHCPEQAEKGGDRRLTGTAKIPLEVGVSDLDKSVEWYGEFLGMKPSDRPAPEGYRLLQGKSTFSEPFHDMVWVKKIPPDQVSRGNPSSRLYFWLNKVDFLHMHEQLQQRNVEASAILGNPGTWAAFHFFDPDGNRINVSTCAY